MVVFGVLGIAAAWMPGVAGRSVSGLFCGALCGALGGTVVGGSAGYVSARESWLWVMPAGMLAGLVIGAAAGGWIGARSAGD